MRYILLILYRLKIWHKITIIGEQNGSETTIHYHFYTHKGMPNVGDYITNKENQLFIVINKSFTYKKSRHTCWILINQLTQKK